MRTILLIIFLGCAICVYSQEMQNEFKRTSIGIVFSPAYCYRSLHYEQSNKWIGEKRNENEMPVFGYTVGVNLKYSFSNKTAFITGLMLSVNGEQTKYENLQWQTQEKKYPVKAKTQFHYEYVTIPFGVMQYFGHNNNNLKFFATANVSLNVFAEKKTNVIVMYNDDDKNRSSSAVDIGNTIFNIAASVGAGVEYNLSRRFSLSAAPSYTRFLNSIVADKNAKEYNYAIAFNVNLFYKLKWKKK